MGVNVTNTGSTRSLGGCRPTDLPRPTPRLPPGGRFDRHPCHAARIHADRACGGRAQVDDPPPGEFSAVVHADRYAAPVGEIRHAYPRAERERAVRCGEAGGIVALAARGSAAIEARGIGGGLSRLSRGAMRRGDGDEDGDRGDDERNTRCSRGGSSRGGPSPRAPRNDQNFHPIPTIGPLRVCCNCTLRAFFEEVSKSKS